MRTHNSWIDGEVDLDDPKLYKYLPKDIDALRLQFFQQVGYSHIYMNFWHKDSFKKNVDGGQRKRINKLIQTFADNERKNYDNLQWYLEMVYLIEDEIENMC